MFFALILLGLSGLLLEGLSFRLAPFLLPLIGGFVGLVTLWRMSNFHLMIIAQKSLSGAPLKKIYLGLFVGACSTILPTIISDKLAAFTLPAGIPALLLVLAYTYKWRGIENRV